MTPGLIDLGLSTLRTSGIAFAPTLAFTACLHRLENVTACSLTAFSGSLSRPSGYSCLWQVAKRKAAAQMGTFLNPGAAMLRRARGSRIYVDKSGLIARLNKLLNTEREFVCVSRPRRFGKTMAANMISAYYDRTVDAAKEFAGLEIAGDAGFEEHRNAYDVIKVNMQEFLSATQSVGELIARLEAFVCRELGMAYPGLTLLDPLSLPQTMSDIFSQTGNQFVIIIDEWDCVMREAAADHEGQRRYLDFLRAWLKDKPYVALAYMTGILPVKKYGSHSALNMFDEYSMLEPSWMAPYMGFTSEEVEGLCREWGRDFGECRAWYDGYRLGDAYDIYNPRSVVCSMEDGRFGGYWTQTETFEALRRYIDMDLDGLHGKVIELVAGGRVEIDMRTYGNDMTTFNRADDVLTLLVHLGYLAYDEPRREVFVPNREVAGEYASATSSGNWGEIARSIAASEALLDALLAQDVEAVARGVEKAHNDVASVIAYNHEEDLACTLRLAFFSAMRRWRLVREAPAGKGYADLLMVPLASSGAIPGVVVELKWGHSPAEALAQMRERDYAAAFRGTSIWENTLLCAVTYDPRTKRHECRIERL